PGVFLCRTQRRSSSLFRHPIHGARRMSRSIAPETWLGFLETEYLDGFVRDGGAAVKFVVPLDDGARPDIVDALCRSSRDRGFVTTRVRADETRVHMIDQVFFRIAGDVPWADLTDHVVLRLAGDLGYSTKGCGDDRPLFEELARLNGIDSKALLMELRKKLSDEVFGQKRLSKDFRVAMTHLCLAKLTGGSAGATTSQALIDWLAGRNTAIAAVKTYQILKKITRTNARHFLESLLWWLRFAKAPGLVIVLEIDRLAVGNNPRDERVYYTKASVLDAYEVLRQFVDSTDRLTGCLIVVMPAASFLEE